MLEIEKAEKDIEIIEKALIEGKLSESKYEELKGKLENKIIEIASKLNLNLKKNLTDACDTLFQEWRKERGLPFKPHMRFEDYDK